MFRIIKFLITGDWHLCKMEILEKQGMTQTQTNDFGGNYNRDYVKYTLQCNHCGRLEKEEI